MLPTPCAALGIVNRVYSGVEEMFFVLSETPTVRTP
jgi:hypothetical protein